MDKKSEFKNFLNKHPEILVSIPKEISILLYSKKLCLTLLESLIYYLYYRRGFISTKVTKVIKKIYQREYERQFCGIQFDQLIPSSAAPSSCSFQLIKAVLSNWAIYCFPLLSFGRERQLQSVSNWFKCLASHHVPHSFSL